MILLLSVKVNIRHAIIFFMKKRDNKKNKIDEARIIIYR